MAAAPFEAGAAAFFEAVAAAPFEAGAAAFFEAVSAAPFEAVLQFYVACQAAAKIQPRAGFWPIVYIRTFVLPLLSSLLSLRNILYSYHLVRCKLARDPLS